MGTYCEYQPPVTVRQRARMVLHRCRARWRARRARPDGRDYTGRWVRVVSMPGPDPRVDVGDVGPVVEAQDLGTRRAMHYITFDGVTWVMPLPSRHLEFVPAPD